MAVSLLTLVAGAATRFGLPLVVLPWRGGVIERWADKGEPGVGWDCGALSGSRCAARPSR
jgi:hypothetical protein